MLSSVRLLTCTSSLLVALNRAMLGCYDFLCLWRLYHNTSDVVCVYESFVSTLKAIIT